MPKTKPRTLAAYEVVNRADPTMVDRFAPAKVDMTCGRKSPHLPHDYDEDWFEGVRRSWLACAGVKG
jgi:hypothetical protein